MAGRYSASSRGNRRRSIAANHRSIATWLLLACASFAATHTEAAQGADVPVLVSDVWVRGATPSQKTTGAFMRLTSTRDLSLVDVASPAAKLVELHEMRRDGTAMRMRRIAKVELAAGKIVKLEPGGYHVMLFGLVQPLKKGGSVPLTLSFADPQGHRWTLAVSAEVRDLTATMESTGAGSKE